MGRELNFKIKFFFFKSDVYKQSMQFWKMSFEYKIFSDRRGHMV